MPDRQKVIKGLECCKPAWFTVKNCTDESCPYNCYGHEFTGCVDHLIDDALELLKEQEPHVLSREEMIEAGKNHDAVYVEEGDGRCFWGLAVEGIDPPEDKPYNYPGGVLFNVVDADDDMWDGDFYLMCDVYPEVKPHPMGWRAWSAKPAPEQMRAVKWE